MASLFLCPISYKTKSQFRNLNSLLYQSRPYTNALQIPTTAVFIISLLANYLFDWNRHTWDVPIPKLIPGLKMILGAQVVFALATTLTKLSMLALIRRIAVSRTSYGYNLITAAAIAIVSIQGVIFCVVTIFQCRPVSDYWKLTDVPQPNCINQTRTLLAAGVVNILTDIMVVIVPIYVVWKLQLKRRQKIAVVCLFGLGFCSVAAGIARTYFMYLCTVSWDQIWLSYPVWMMSAIELYVGIVSNPSQHHYPLTTAQTNQPDRSVPAFPQRNPSSPPTCPPCSAPLGQK
jgi:hypothetical protein